MLPFTETPVIIGSKEKKKPKSFQQTLFNNRLSGLKDKLVQTGRERANLYNPKEKKNEKSLILILKQKKREKNEHRNHVTEDLKGNRKISVSQN